jgi:hypothetical protein
MTSAVLYFAALLQGRVVSFKNAIIIMTSNLGSAEIFNHAYKAQQHKAASQETGVCWYRSYARLYDGVGCC